MTRSIFSFLFFLLSVCLCVSLSLSLSLSHLFLLYMYLLIFLPIYQSFVYIFSLYPSTNLHIYYTIYICISGHIKLAGYPAKMNFFDSISSIPYFFVRAYGTYVLKGGGQSSSGRGRLILDSRLR